MARTEGRLRAKHTLILLTLALALACARNSSAVGLELDGWRASIDPATLEVKATVAGDREPLQVAAGIGKSHQVANLAQSATRVSWTLPDLGLTIVFSAQGGRLVARFNASGDAKLAWPSTDDPRLAALILPEGEGLYVPFADAAWVRRMSGGCAGLSGGLSMPFWSFRVGTAADSRTLTYFARTDLRSELCLEEHAGRLAATVTREFQRRDGDQPYEVEIWFGGASPIAPALEYRERLREAGALHTLEQKARANPEVAKLAGATHMYVWGDGRKPAFIADLVAAGARRAWIGYDQDEYSRQSQAGQDFVAAAKAAGFLVGPYEAYSNAQDPASGDALSRWPGKLYPEGCIVDRDGKSHAGFASRGCELSSEALAKAEPMLRPLAARIDKQLRDGVNSYFVDVDAFGELFDDYSPAHPMTVFRDRENRMHRLQVARDRKVVLGSEEGVAWSLPLIDFAHGAFSVRNNVLWKERRSFGAWWPPDRPAIFFNAVEPSAEFRASKFDPAFRLPLYEAAFHDAVVATDRWDVPMAQFPSQAATRQLLEQLYGVPSMWVMDRRLLAEWRASLTPLLAFFQPLHERIATLPLTSFEWLTADRRVQRTRFSDEVTLTANFGSTAFDRLNPGCVEARWRDTRTDTFCPATHAPAKAPVAPKAR